MTAPLNRPDPAQLICSKDNQVRDHMWSRSFSWMLFRALDGGVNQAFIYQMGYFFNSPQGMARAIPIP